MRISAHASRNVERRCLDAEIVFEIKDHMPVTKAGSELTAGRSDWGIRLLAESNPGLRKRLRPLLLALLFDSLFYRNRIGDVTGWTGFAGIVCGFRAARGVCRLA